MRRGEILIFLALLIGFSPGQAAGPPNPAGPLELGMELASSEKALDSGRVTTEFNLFALRDLWVRVKVPKIGPASLLNLTFTTPRGEVFYETNRFFSHRPQVTTMRLPGQDHPVTVFPAKRLARGFGLDLPIPIAGSVFQRYPHFGAWVVQAKLSGPNETLSTKLEVRVTP